MEKDKVIIVGGGPAGMIAAIQLMRYGIKPRVFESNQLGGLLWNANLVENYPGFPGGIPGPDLVALFVKQFEALALSIMKETVTRIDYNGIDFVVRSNERDYMAASVIIATGTRPKTFADGFIPRRAYQKTFYEVAPLLDVKNKQIAIIEAGDAAFDYAINLSRNNQILILNRGEEIKALPLLVKRCAKIRSIEYRQNNPVTSVSLDEEKLILEIVGTDENKKICVDLLIGAIGRELNLPLLSERLKKAQQSLISSNQMHFVGDVWNGIYRQTAIAVGDGLRAAMKTYKFLKEYG